MRARGSVRVERLSDERELSSPELERELLGASAICAGEEHDSAAQHYGELWLLERLARFAPNLGLEFGVGFEIFQAPFQPAVDAYIRGEIELETLLSETEYEDRWGYPFAYYRPLVERAYDLRLPLVALNAEEELTQHIARHGLDAVEGKLAKSLPSLDLYDIEHRRDFERAMQGHPGLTPARLDNYYAAQVVWDETMAARAASWLSEHAPMRRLLVIAGRAHCQKHAIPARIERRVAGRVVSVVLSTEKPSPELRARYDFALIVGPPD
jgi:uncharacterized iron-regulated protein